MATQHLLAVDEEDGGATAPAEGVMQDAADTAQPATDDDVIIVEGLGWCPLTRGGGINKVIQSFAFVDAFFH